MRTVIEIEKVNNGFIINGKDTGVKKVAGNAGEVSKMIATELSHLFEQIKDGEIKTFEFELK